MALKFLPQSTASNGLVYITTDSTKNEAISPETFMCSHVFYKFSAVFENIFS